MAQKLVDLVDDLRAEIQVYEDGVRDALDYASDALDEIEGGNIYEATQRLHDAIRELEAL